MSELEEDLDEITEPIVDFLRAKAFLPILFIFQLYLLVAGGALWGISTKITTLYLILPWGLFGFYYVQRKITFTDLEDMTYKKDPISKYLTGRHYGVTGRSLIIQVYYFILAFMVAWLALLILVNAGLLAVQTMRRTEALGMVIMTLALVAPSETLAFHAIIPTVWRRSEVLRAFPKRFRKPVLYASTQAIFALFHTGVLGGELGSLLFIFFAGILFLTVTDNYGIAPTFGLHAAWNLVILGAISGGIIGV